MSLRKYVKIRDLGIGNFGTAVLVKCLGDDKQLRFFCDFFFSYALKTINLKNLDTKQKKNSVNEIKVLSTLKHPFIITYVESFLDQQNLCIVMEFAPNGDLYSLIKKQRLKGKFFEESEILRWFTQISLGLKYMHEKHILHRDLKTRNIFIMNDGRLRIGDFGISKIMSSTFELARTAIGTPYYLSPEICNGIAYSWSSDIWSLGCILHELCALELPFKGNSIGTLIQKICNEDTQNLAKKYNPEIVSLHDSLLQRDHEKRPNISEILKLPIIQNEIRKMLKQKEFFPPNKKQIQILK